jgi:hypothetical protein
MAGPTKESVFKTGNTAKDRNNRADQTTIVARELMQAEETARVKKTERLRALRLAREAEDAAATPAPRTVKARAKAKA